MKWNYVRQIKCANHQSPVGCHNYSEKGEVEKLKVELSLALTCNVQLEVGGKGYGLVVVDGLAGEDGSQVALFDGRGGVVKVVDGGGHAGAVTWRLRRRLVSVVYQNVLTVPRKSGWGIASSRCTRGPKKYIDTKSSFWF